MLSMSGQQAIHQIDDLHDTWNHALLKTPPSQFWAEALAMPRRGGTFYGIQVYPLDRAPESLKWPHQDYTVWRTWDDCLEMQASLETEYRQLASEKRNKLVSAKSPRKRGLYTHDRTASLPSGPDTSTIPKDIHQILPKLTKRGTFFRPSSATVAQRLGELQALISALFSDETPTWVKQLIREPKISNFFGYWRRDREIVAKEDTTQKKKDKSPAAHPRSSITSSAFSMYFSSASAGDLRTPPTPDLDLPPVPPLPQRVFRETHDLPRPVSTSTLPSPTVPVAIPAHLQQHKRSESYDATIHGSLKSPHSSPALSSIGSRESLAVPSPIVVAQEVPLIFEHNPEDDVHDRGWGGLPALPEEAELKIPFSPINFLPEKKEKALPDPPRRSRNGERQANKKARVYLASSPHTPPYDVLDTRDVVMMPDGGMETRLSWQSSASADSTDFSAAYLQNLDFVLPPSPSNEGHNSKNSTNSLTSFLTDNSADAIFPRTILASTSQPSSPTYIRERNKTSPVPEDVTYSRRTDTAVENRLPNSPRNRTPSPTTPSFLERRPKQPTKSSSTMPFHARSSPLSKVEELPVASRRRDATEPKPSPTFLESVQPSSPSRRLASNTVRRVATTEFPTSRTSKEPGQPKQPTSASSPLRPSRSALRSEKPAKPVPKTLPPMSPEPTSPWTSVPTVTIKAVYKDESIVVLRAPRDITYADIRHRLQHKFVNQEGVPLSDSFTMAFVLPANVVQPDEVDPSRARTRATSLSTAGIPDLTKVRFVRNQVEWSLVVNFAGKEKMVFRIIDTLV